MQVMLKHTKKVRMNEDNTGCRNTVEPATSRKYLENKNNTTGVWHKRMKCVSEQAHNTTATQSGEDPQDRHSYLGLKSCSVKLY